MEIKPIVSFHRGDGRSRTVTFSLDDDRVGAMIVSVCENGHLRGVFILSRKEVERFCSSETCKGQKNFAVYPPWSSPRTKSGQAVKERYADLFVDVTLPERIYVPHFLKLVKRATQRHADAEG